MARDFEYRVSSKDVATVKIDLHRFCARFGIERSDPNRLSKALILLVAQWVGEKAHDEQQVEAVLADIITLLKKGAYLNFAKPSKPGKSNENV